MVVDTAGHCVAIDADARELRRLVGANAWLVLEELILRSQSGAEGLVATASVRALADSLGVAKDTAARAVCRLRAAGIVRPAQQRSPAGTFESGTYAIELPAGVDVIQSIRPSRTRNPRPRIASTELAQLSLALDA